MAYDILWANKAELQFSKVDAATKMRIIKRLDEIRANPFLHVAKLADLNLYKLRIGSYRVILSIESDSMIILKVGHRKNIYKK